MLKVLLRFWRSSPPQIETQGPGDGSAVLFYRNQCRDQSGRTLSEILTWDHARLARCHDYIQWLFPSGERSEFNPRAPVPGPQDVAAFLNDAALRESLMRSFVMMLGFFGLRLEHGGRELRVVRGENYDARAQVWVTPGNHQALRITRILRSLFVLGLPVHAQAFLECLQQIATEHPDAIGEEALRHWMDAVAPPVTRSSRPT